MTNKDVEVTQELTKTLLRLKIIKNAQDIMLRLVFELLVQDKSEIEQIKLRKQFNGELNEKD